MEIQMVPLATIPYLALLLAQAVVVEQDRDDRD
jgi:hypothetical protein